MSPTSWGDMSEKARELDVQLFPLLQSAIQGTWMSLLDGVVYPLFTQGMVLLWNHHDLNSGTRVTSAIQNMLAVRFEGNVSTYQISVFSAVDELIRSKATIPQFILSCIMNSGLPSNVKLQIAKDINEKDIDTLNIYDMLRGYCSTIAAVSHAVR